MPSAFNVQDKTLSKKAEIAEGDKLRAEGNEASLRFAISVLNAIECDH